MKEYKITYKETLIHTFYVTADDEEEARNAFDEEVNMGLVDFSDGEITETEICVKEIQIPNGVTDEDDITGK